MCFYHDYDWYAIVSEDDRHHVAAAPARCEECGDCIHRGQRCRYVYQQQYEECRRCGGYDGDPCDGGDRHDFGEVFECHVCHRCQLLLDAVQEVEQEAGCHYPESLPAFGELRESFWQSNHAAEYIDRAFRDSPELAASGHLDRFYVLTDESVAADDEWTPDDFAEVEVYGGEG